MEDSMRWQSKLLAVFLVAIMELSVQAQERKFLASPAQALQSAYLPAASMLNYGWENQVGSIEKGKFADIIAVSGNPFTDVTEMERVKLVMKGGMIVRDELSSSAIRNPGR